MEGSVPLNPAPWSLRNKILQCTESTAEEEAQLLCRCVIWNPPYQNINQ